MRAANVTICKNNLKQIGWPCTTITIRPGLFRGSKRDHGSGDDDGPGGGYVDLGPGWSWAAALLDRLEQDNLKSHLDMTASMLTPQAKSWTTTVLPVFVCPSDIGPATFQVKDRFGLPLSMVARANYLAMFGFGEPTDDTGNGEGMFFRNSSIRIADVTDGLSNTLAIGERASTVALGAWAGAVPNGCVKNLSGIPGSVDGEAPVFAVGHTGTATEGQTPNNNLGYVDDFCSLHPGGVNFLYGDGSVRFITNAINPVTWVALGTRAGGEVISGDF